MHKIKIKKGDEVIVVAGKDKGKKGKVLGVLPKLSAVLVSGINLVTKHNKPSKGASGSIIKKELPIHVSNVAFFDVDSNSHTKLGYKITVDGSKVRFCKKSGKLIETGGN